MKSIFTIISLASAILFAGCGSEKPDEKKENGNPVSEETKQKFDELRAEWSVIDGDFSLVESALNNYDENRLFTYVDSVRTIVDKLSPEMQEKSNVILDSIITLSVHIKKMKPELEGEKQAWGKITEDFNAVLTEIEKGEGTEEKIAPRSEGFTGQFDYKRKSLKEFTNVLDAVKRQNDAILTVLAPAK